ncbi:21430_t:CDS:2 [Cetraspora pellucida]|uniref:21430_t:CDS:1 n=1 Tax=Cetraspora pellucida TaxID=1433469 RepID=A0A9N9F398_9GLOM|nr:21430_t:CDS:2 [Cetraspora pellucida]
MSTQLNNLNRNIDIETSELGNYSKNHWSFSYFIVAEGSYPHYSILCYILPPKEYPIPDNYSIKTT